MTEKQTKIADRADKIQAEMHEIINDTISKNKKT